MWGTAEVRGTAVRLSTHNRRAFLTQFMLLVGRAFTIMMRERATNIARFGQVSVGRPLRCCGPRATCVSSSHAASLRHQVLVFSVLLSLIWLNEAEGDAASNVQAVAGVIFFLLINQVRAELRASCFSDREATFCALLAVARR